MILYTVAICPTLSIENGEVEYHPSQDNGEYPTGTVAFFTCEEGYMRSGSVFGTCQDSGTWDSQVPTCEESIKEFILTQLFCRNHMLPFTPPKCQSKVYPLNTGATSINVTLNSNWI